MGTSKFMIMLFGRMGCGKSHFAKEMKNYVDLSLGRDTVKIVNVSKILLREFDLLVDMFGRRNPYTQQLILDADLVQRTNIPHYITTYLEHQSTDKIKFASLMKRKILQKYGTEVASLRSAEDVFIEMLMKEIDEDPEYKNHRFFINDGCRFPFEIDVVARHGFIPIPVVMDVSDDVTLRTFYDRYINCLDPDDIFKSVPSYFNDPVFSPLFHYSEFAYRSLKNMDRCTFIFGRYSNNLEFMKRVNLIMDVVEKEVDSAKNT